MHVYTSSDPVRNRVLIEWFVIKCRHGQDTWYALCGVVERGDVNERPLAEGANVRWTSTSPIATTNGRVVMTESGSTYALKGEPSSVYYRMLTELGIIYNPDFPIPDIFCLPGN